MLGNLLKDDGRNLIFQGHMLDIYVPIYYFDSNYAEIIGSKVTSFGLLNCKIYDKDEKSLALEIIKLPTQIHMYPSDIYEATVALYPHQTESKYKVLRFYRNDPVMDNFTQCNKLNIEMFTKIFFAGKLDDSIPYDKIIEIWEKNMEVNNIRLNVPITILGIIVSQHYRDKNNPDKTFAKVIGKDPTVSPYDYRRVNIREICSKNTFAALTFEDMDSMITTSLNINSKNKVQDVSPIEKIIKM